MRHSIVSLWLEKEEHVKLQLLMCRLELLDLGTTALSHALVPSPPHRDTPMFGGATHDATCLLGQLSSMIRVHNLRPDAAE